MSEFNKFSAESFEQLRKKLSEALKIAEATGAAEIMKEALRESNELLQTLREPAVDRSSRYAGYIDYTFEDDECDPYGREVDVRIYYSWYGYDPADEPSPIWGATVEDIDVLAVRYFDKDGNETVLSEHHLELAWNLLNRQHEQVTEACTNDGYFNGGNVPATYVPLRPNVVASPTQTRFAGRMAPSARKRESTSKQRKYG
jgi:hypothetical protein